MFLATCHKSAQIGGWCSFMVKLVTAPSVKDNILLGMVCSLGKLEHICKRPVLLLVEHNIWATKPIRSVENVGVSTSQEFWKSGYLNQSEVLKIWRSQAVRNIEHLDILSCQECWIYKYIYQSVSFNNVFEQ